SGKSVFAALKLAVVESRLPTLTGHDGPPTYSLTTTGASHAATAKMSAHETTPGQIRSTAVLAASITSNPLAELAFGPADFSLWIVGESSRRIEASQPCTKQS
ncbi:UPF0339 protein BP0521, partial [Striga asiatica]